MRTTLPIANVPLLVALSVVSAGTFETATIKDTAYPIPPNAYHVATSGDDVNPGTEAAPFETVGHAIGVAPAGSTIVIRGGIYREPGSTFAKPLTLQPYPHERVWLKGSLVVTGWVADGGLWRKDGWTHEFDPDTYPPDSTQAGSPYAVMPDMVFVDGEPLAQVGSLAEMGAATFFGDVDGDRLYIGVDPQGKSVEAAARARALRAVNASASGTVIRGLGFMHYAGGRFEGAVQCDTASTVFENNTVAWNAGKGLAVFTSPATVVRGNTLIYNGQMGLAAWRADGLVVEQNRIAANNQEGFVLSGTVSEAAGSKITDSEHLTIRDNIVEDNLANGLWFDLSIYDAIVVRNLVRNNAKNGVYFEVSSNGIVASNVVTGNDAGIVVSNAADVWVYNNTLVDNAEHLAVVDDDRVNADQAEIALGITHVTDGVVLTNNILSNGDGGDDALLFARDYNSTPIKDADDMIAIADFNAYYRTDSSVPPDLVEWWRGTTALRFADLATFRRVTGDESSGIAIDDIATNPFFVDGDAGNYRLHAASVAVGAGDPLPQAVAEAIGVDVAAAPDLGAFIGRSGADPPLSVPDGTAGTDAVRAVRADGQGNRIVVDWDDRCNPFNVKLIYGPLDAVADYTVTGAVCSIRSAHTWDPVPAGDLWFLVVGDNAFGTEGSWGDGTAGERNGTSTSGTCGATIKLPSGSCP